MIILSDFILPIYCECLMLIRYSVSLKNSDYPLFREEDPFWIEKVVKFSGVEGILFISSIVSSLLYATIV